MGKYDRDLLRATNRFSIEKMQFICEFIETRLDKLQELNKKLGVIETKLMAEKARLRKRKRDR